METPYKEALQTLGFSEKEASVYLALLEMGIGSAVGIARKAEIKRSTTYVVLDELIRKGAVVTVPRSKKKLFRPIPPQSLFEFYERRFKAAKEALPAIKAMARQESYKPQVLLYEGVEGVKESLDYGMKKLAGGEIKGFYAKSTPKILKAFDNFKAYNDFLKENEITMRGISPEDPSLKSFREDDIEYGREFKEISKEKYSADTAIEIGDTFVRFFDPVNLQSLVIENPAITQTMSQIFELVWEER